MFRREEEEEGSAVLQVGERSDEDCEEKHTEACWEMHKDDEENTHL